MTFSSRLLIACFTLLLLAVIVDCQNPEVKITEPVLPKGINSFVAQAGSMVDMVCVVRNKPPDRNVKWMRIHGNKTVFISNDVDPEDQMYSVIKPNSISWKLRIKNVQVSMNGPYICYVSHTSHSETKDLIWLIVIKKPRINNILTSKDKTVSENEPLDLNCEAEGIPPPVIKWTRLALADLPSGGKELRKSSLSVAKVRADHRGKYICQADNQGGQARRVISVYVRFRPIVTPEHKFVYQAVGYSKLLTCDIEAYPPPTKEQISWTRGGENINLDQNFLSRTSLGANDRVTARLYIRKVRAGDYGEYVCGASNTFGTRRATIELLESDDPSAEPSIYKWSSSSRNSSSLFITFLMILSILWSFN